MRISKKKIVEKGTEMYCLSNSNTESEVAMASSLLHNAKGGVKTR